MILSDNCLFIIRLVRICKHSFGIIFAFQIRTTTLILNISSIYEICLNLYSLNHLDFVTGLCGRQRQNVAYCSLS